MALIKCKECGAEISSNALSCPKCGSSEINKAVKAGAKAYLGCWAAIIGFIAFLALVGSIISSIESRKPKIKIIRPTEVKEIPGSLSNFSAKDYPSGWPFTVESINVTCIKSKTGNYGILAKTGGKTYALNQFAKTWLGHPYPRAILDIKGFNKIKELDVSNKSWVTFKPFSRFQSLSGHIGYMTGDSPLGEALIKVCGH